jgi:hypothetical protein
MVTELRAWAIAHHRSVAEKSGMIRTCLAEWEERPALAPKACEGGLIAFADGLRYFTVARERRLIGADGSIEGAMLMLVNAIFMDAMTRDVMAGNHPWSAEASIATFVDLVLRALGATELA